METLVLKANKRDGSVKNAEYRAQSLVLAECYGPGKENVSVVVNSSEFIKTYRKAGESTVIDLEIDGKAEKVLVHEVVVHPLNDSIEHVDFKFVDMNVAVVASVPLVFVGVSPAVKNEGGVLVESLQEVEVKALPGDLPHDIEVDISVLEDFHSVIHVSDLKLTDKVEMITDEALTVATVSAPRSAVEDESELSPEEQEKAAMEAAVGKEEDSE